MNNICTCCNNELVDNGDLVEIYCKHIFHVKCFNDHIENIKTCPTCNRELEYYEYQDVNEDELYKLIMSEIYNVIK